ncbi:MAG: tetratricopeptide repeat protein [Planctomycetota bacterium]
MRTAFSLALALLVVAPATLFAQDEEDDPFARLYGDDDDTFGDDDLPTEPIPRAWVLLEHGRHDEAEALFSSAAANEDASDDELGYALEGLGRLLLKTGRDDELPPILERLAPVDSARAKLLGGILAEHRGELDQALQGYREAFALTKASASYHRLEALVRQGELLRHQDTQAAGQAFEQVLTLYSAQSQLTAREFTWVARACRRLDVFPDVKRGYAKGMVEYSRRMLDQAQLSDATYTGCYVEAGELALAKYDTVGALKNFEKACRLDPNNPQARVGLARSLTEAFYRGQGRYQSAADNLKQALAINPTYAPAHATLAATDITDGLYEEAAERLEIGLRARPADVDLLAYQAALPMLRGDKARFKQLEDALLAKRPKCARFYEVIADLIGSKRFRYAEARDLARKGLIVRPGYHPLLTILGMNLTRTNEEEEGLRLLKQAFEEDPYNVFTFNYLQLFDRLEEQYVTATIPGFVVRMHKDEEVVADHVFELLAGGSRRAPGPLSHDPADRARRVLPQPQRLLVPLGRAPGHADPGRVLRQHHDRALPRRPREAALPLLGAHALARVRPRGDADPHREPHPALVHRGAERLRGVAGSPQLGADLRRGHHVAALERAPAPDRDPGRGLHQAQVRQPGDHELLPGRDHLRVHRRSLGLPDDPGHARRLPRGQAHPAGDPARPAASSPRTSTPSSAPGSSAASRTTPTAPPRPPCCGTPGPSR